MKTPLQLHLIQLIEAGNRIAIRRMLEDETKRAQLDLESIDQTALYNGLKSRVLDCSTLAVLLDHHSGQKRLFDSNISPSAGIPTMLLQAAVQYRRHDCVQLLLNHHASDADPNIPYPKNGETLLHVAAGAHLDFDMAKMLLQHGADPNAVDSQTGESVLHRVFASGIPRYRKKVRKLLKLCLQHGANPETEDRMGRSLLCMAIRVASRDMVTQLLKYGASSTKPIGGFGTDDDEDGNDILPPLSWTVKEIIRVLERAMVHPKRRSYRKRIAALLNGVMNALLEYGNPEDNDVFCDSMGRKALFLAASLDEEDLVQYFLEKGADPKLPCSGGKSALVASIESRRAYCTRALLKNGADCNSVGEDGRSPLAAVIDCDKWQCVRDLLQYGADPNKPCKDGKSPLFLAVTLGHVNCTKALFDGGARPSLCQLCAPDDRIKLTLLALENSTGEVSKLRRDEAGNVVYISLKWRSWEFRPEIFEMQHLKTLVLPNISHYDRFPEGFCRFRNLKALVLRCIPTGTELLESLESMEIVLPDNHNRLPCTIHHVLPPNLKSLHVENVLLCNIPLSLPSSLESLALICCGIEELRPEEIAIFPPRLRVLQLNRNPILYKVWCAPTLASLLELNDQLEITFPKETFDPHLFTPKVRYLSVFNKNNGCRFLRQNNTIPPSCWPLVLGRVQGSCNFDYSAQNRNTEASVLFTLLRESFR